MQMYIDFTYLPFTRAYDVVLYLTKDRNANRSKNWLNLENGSVKNAQDFISKVHARLLNKFMLLLVFTMIEACVSSDVIAGLQNSFIDAHSGFWIK